MLGFYLHIVDQILLLKGLPSAQCAAQVCKKKWNAMNGGAALLDGFSIFRPWIRRKVDSNLKAEQAHGAIAGTSAGKSRFLCVIGHVLPGTTIFQ